MEIPTQEELDTAHKVMEALINAMYEHEPYAEDSIKLAEAGFAELPSTIEEWPGIE